MVDRLIRVALVAPTETSFQHIHQSLASLDGFSFKLEWLCDSEIAAGDLDPIQYDVCLVEYEAEKSNVVSRLGPPREWHLHIPIVLLCPRGQPESTYVATMDWLPLNDLSATQLKRSIYYAMERHHLFKALRVAQDAADSALRMQHAFLATMSDEMRTPMNGVIGMAELLMETELTAEQLDHAETIRTSGRLLSTAINDVLDLSKLKAESTCLELTAFKLDELVAGVIVLFADHAHRKDVDLGWSICEDVPEVLAGDASLLQQLLINLISNAVKFTPAGHIDVRITLDDETEDEVLVCFEIEDTGIGIPLDLHDRLFQPFSQADASNARKQRGTGLGLAIARHIATAMKGSITFESKPGHGSTFRCKLHLHRFPD